MTTPASAHSELFIGLMSGTSLDGVDAVLADFSGTRAHLVGATYIGFPSQLRESLLALQSSGDDELHRTAIAANALVDIYVAAIAQLLAATGVEAGAVAAVGAHGQTVRHRPSQHYTWQINNPARLAEMAAITVIADFRARDVAAGGQGAPLVPAFHAALFQQPHTHRVAVNIGGIGNITNLPPGMDGEGVTGWDTGPGNVLMDLWCERHRGTPYDDDGNWAASGIVDVALLARLRTEPYFTQTPPKSTGRDLFNAEWLDARIGLAPVNENVQSTLLQLTVDTIAGDIARHCAEAQEVIICGGGARNGALMKRLATALAIAAADSGKALPSLQRSDDLGVPSNQVEAFAFAWLARQALRGEPGNLPAVTGARGRRILGAVYPA
ncbi:MAG: anhydro-N-acetylmuramic acid kinase [Betaproteobacteria bacterium]